MRFDRVLDLAMLNLRALDGQADFQSRGIDMEQAVSMIINGFVKDVFTQLPMEFAVEASNLLGLKLEGSVG